MIDIIPIVLTSVVTGVLSTVGTVAALRIHIIYIRENLARNETAINRAHARIDALEGRHE